MPRHEQPSSNGSRPKDHSSLATFQPHPAGLDSFTQAANQENATRLELARNWTRPSRASVIPAGAAGTGTAAIYEDPGVVMNAPSAEAEFQAFKESVIRDKDNAPDRIWMGTDSDVAFRKRMHDQKRAYDKQKWLLSLVDVRLPMNAQWLNNIAPEIMSSRAETIANESKKRARMEWIKAYGIHTREDADLIHGIVSGAVNPDFARNSEYTNGWFLDKKQRFGQADAMTTANYAALGAKPTGLTSLWNPGMKDGNVPRYIGTGALTDL